MNAAHILETNLQPLGVVKNFIAELWEAMDLEGMLMPTYQAGTTNIYHRFIHNPLEIADLNPFIPFVPINAASKFSLLAAEHSSNRIAVILRPCEARAWFYHTKSSSNNYQDWLIVGVDCLASYPVQDLEWRAKRAGGIEPLTREALRFARQGGIAPYRYRVACQMCMPSAPEYVDINIGLIGLPIKRYIIIEINRKDTVDYLNIGKITSGCAPSALLAQRENTLVILENRHDATFRRFSNSLPAEIPTSPDTLVRYLNNCAPCQSCLEACPIYAGELANHGNGNYSATKATLRWLSSCVMCGQCEQACPRQIALTTIHKCIKLQLTDLSVDGRIPILS